MSPDPVTPSEPVSPEPPVSDPPAPPATDPPPPPPVAPEGGSRTVENRLEGMETAVANLVDTITGLITKTTESTPEVKPVKKPWTHWGSK